MEGSIKSRSRLIIGAMVAVACVLVFGAATAYADGSWHSLSGTCSPYGYWYTSTNVRVVGFLNTGGYVELKPSTTPVGGLTLYIQNYLNGHPIGYQKSWPVGTTDTKVLASGVMMGTNFVNVYKETSASGGSRYWAGSEYY